ncbi:hypodermin-B-like isoform X2 [Choristoneura fumiferana]|uniref:hypodermin-B-like isoform X2 n=1 Tax=Choristoneura fumiferana TaxID=7141 RepID=UPI003D15574F
MAEENTILCFVLIISVFHSVTLQEFEGFVVEGDFAKMKDFPHAALLYIECRESSDNPTRYFTCGSSIINQDIVLTAAHCLENCAAKFTIVTVHVGNREKKKGLPIKASGFKTHGKYNPRTISNDIALVKLKNRLVFGKKVRRVALMREPPYDETAEVAGWGWLNRRFWQRSYSAQIHTDRYRLLQGAVEVPPPCHVHRCCLLLQLDREKFEKVVL